MENYKVTEQSACFVEALRAFHKSQEHLLNGLYKQYGEDMANDVFDKTFGPRFREAEQIYFDALGMSVMDIINTRLGTNEI